MKEGKDKFNLTTIFKGFLTAFNINRGILPTLRDLLIKPGLVINYYIEGKVDKYGYNKYFSPGRFFVTVLAALSVFAFFSVDVSDDLMRDLTLASYNEGHNATTEALAGDIPEASILAAKSSAAAVEEKTFDLFMFFINNQMFAFLLLILPATLSTRVVFKSAKYNIAKHLVVNIYCFCFIALITGIISFCFNQEEYAMYMIQRMEYAKNNIATDVVWKFECYTYGFYLIPILYYCYSFKSIFNGSWISSIFKTIGSLILSSLIIFLCILILIIFISA